MNHSTFVTRAQSILRDNAAARSVGRQLSGPKLDQPRLALVPTGDLRAFRRPATNRTRSYAAHVLLDCSGSMNRETGSPLAVAAEATHALAMALLASGCSVTVTGFNRYRWPFPPDTVADPQLLYAAAEHAQRNRLPDDTGHAGDGNHDHTAITFAARALMRDPAQGKLLLVLSDGEPDCYRRCQLPDCTHSDNGYALRKALIPITRLPISLAAVGILTGAPSQFYGPHRTATVNRLDQLYPTLLAVLSRQLTRGT